MATNGKKWPRYFAILIALVMIMETIAFTLTSYAKNDTNSIYELNDEDKETASEISNMTGVKADEIIKLRKEGKSWNQILELIKNNPGCKSEENGTKRKSTLAQNGMDEAILSKLKEEGFTEEEISEAKSLAERIIFQLEEIANMQVMTPSVPDNGLNSIDRKEADITAYKELTGKICLSEAVYLILELRNELGTIHSAFDEYLCSLQLDIDLNLYLTNKEEYQKQKQQKMAEMALKHIITSADVEEKMLDMLQSMNMKAEETPEAKNDIPSIPDMIKESPLPDVQSPNTQDIKPQDPSKTLIQEIESIKNNGTD